MFNKNTSKIIDNSDCHPRAGGDPSKYKKYISIFTLSVFLFFTLICGTGIFSTTLVLAQTINTPNLTDTSPTQGQGIVQCGTMVDENGIVSNPCKFEDLFKLINTLMQYALWLVTMILTGVVAYAGFRYMMSRGNPSEVQKANHMFWLVIKGLIWMLCAWLIVYTISNTFLKTGYTTFLKQ